MKKENAEKLMCPFIMNGESYVKCITDKCMAWRTTLYEKLEDKKLINTLEGYCNLIGEVNKHDNR